MHTQSIVSSHLKFTFISSLKLKRSYEHILKHIGAQRQVLKNIQKKGGLSWPGYNMIYGGQEDYYQEYLRARSSISEREDIREITTSHRQTYVKL